MYKFTYVESTKKCLEYFTKINIFREKMISNVTNIKFCPQNVCQTWNNIKYCIFLRQIRQELEYWLRTFCSRNFMLKVIMNLQKSICKSKCYHFVFCWKLSSTKIWKFIIRQLSESRTFPEVPKKASQVILCWIFMKNMVYSIQKIIITLQESE